jgi:oligosaccharide repeat unit polymerase
VDLFLFDILIILLIVIDMHNYEKQITPLTIFGGVYTCLINLNNLVISKVYAFIPINAHALRVIFSFFIIIFCIDFCGGYLYRNTPHCSFSFSTRFKNYASVTVLFFIGFAAYGIQFLLLYRTYGLSIKGLNDGILGHLSSFAFILGPVALDLSIKTGKRIRIMFALLLNILVLGISVAFGGKYVIFINLTYFLLYFVLKRDRRANLMKLIKIILPLIGAAVGAFMILYYVIPIVTGQYQSTMDFAIRRMFYYLLGSVTANNYTMLHAGQGDDLIPFTVIVNIGKALFGNHDYISAIYPFIFQVDNITKTNVAGFLGETVYNLGISGALFYTAVIFVIINYFYYQYRSKNRFYLSFCYSTAIIAFLFFCNFYSVSGVFLPLLLSVFLDMISLCRIRHYHI